VTASGECGDCVVWVGDENVLTTYTQPQKRQSMFSGQGDELHFEVHDLCIGLDCLLPIASISSLFVDSSNDDDDVVEHTDGATANTTAISNSSTNTTSESTNTNSISHSLCEMTL
jgi:hypothetical protein